MKEYTVEGRVTLYLPRPIKVIAECQGDAEALAVEVIRERGEVWGLEVEAHGPVE